MHFCAGNLGCDYPGNQQELLAAKKENLAQTCALPDTLSG